MARWIAGLGIIWFGFAQGLFAQAAPHEEFFPLESGSQWVYRCSGACAGEGEIEIRITGAQEFGGKPYKMMESSAGRRVLLRVEGRNLREYDTGSGREAVMAAMGTPPPVIFGDWPEGCKPSARVAEPQLRDGRFRTAGMTMVAEYQGPGCEGAGVIREVYAPGPGLIRRIERANAGERVWELVRFEPGSGEDQDNRLSVTVELDREIYYMGAEMEPSPNQERPIPELRATIRVRNNTAAAISLRFATGQRYDLALRNSGGELFYQWSRPQLFTQAISQENFPPGDTTYTVAVPLVDARGRRLPPGIYEAVGRLTPMGEAAPHLEDRKTFQLRYGVPPQ